MIASRLTKQPRNSEFGHAPERNAIDLDDLDQPVTDDVITTREKDI